MRNTTGKDCPVVCRWISVCVSSEVPLSSLAVSFTCYFDRVFSSWRNPAWWVASRPFFFAQSGFSPQMAVIRRKPWFKFSLSLHRSALSKTGLWSVNTVPSKSWERRAIRGLAQESHSGGGPCTSGCWGNWQIYSPVAPWLFSGEARLLLQPADLDVCLLLAPNVSTAGDARHKWK